MLSEQTLSCMILEQNQSCLLNDAALRLEGLSSSTLS